MFIETNDNLKLYVKKSGEGTPCIFIHGGPGAWSKDFEVYCGEKLEKSFEMIYLDQRGCGRSEGDENTDYSINKIVEDIELIRKKLNIKRWILLAHSFGGIIATSYVNKYQENVHGLILANCTLNFNQSLESQINKGYELLNITRKENEINLIEEWKKVAYNLVKEDKYYILQYKDYNNYIKMNSIDDKIININMSNQSFNNKSYFLDYCKLSEKINTPTLIIIGSEDYAIGVKHFENFKFQDKIIKTINGKHTPYLEDTSEFIKVIEEYVFSIKNR
ncbi:2-succinyl-6-hydroxy-2,4-cyclohexadiene-1-carboxylate synthase [bioreactor metagenome]|uniref:2-succinyl-6-hydroxy-2, 4-cyclohexadiene-1-carboxylate synthase n=1 Tax=bioreactor metagenome TaxID=1076179 RepID=A0A645BW06_9ZZZZ|nr:alpha/beta hydrolase [Romboutsia lituseburensis]